VLLSKLSAPGPYELERRDPAGFACWLAEGLAGGSDPADFVRSGGDLDADAA